MSDPKPGGLPFVDALIPAKTARWWPVKWYADQQTHDSPSNIARPMVLADLCALVSALDDEGKRVVAKALGYHVCDSCHDMRAGTWEEARDVGWVHGTYGPGPDGATLCAECHAGQGE